MDIMKSMYDMPSMFTGGFSTTITAAVHLIANLVLLMFVMFVS